MHGATEFLKALATVLGVAALTTVVFQRLRQPVVLGYLLAGLIVGPHIPIPLVADRAIVETLSELGVILLMFSIGLELSLKKLRQVGLSAVLIAVAEVSIMVWLGFSVGRVLGWSPRESFFAGAVLAISSTTIVVKAFAEQGIGGRLRELVLGVLVVQDLLAILLMAALTAIATGKGLSVAGLAATAGRLLGFLAALLAVGLLIVPRVIRAVVRLDRPETTLVASVGLCFAVALLARHVGYSVALGAFVSGALVSESGEGRRVERLVEPLRDMFAAVFFVSVGMLIDPTAILVHWRAVALMVVVVIAGQITSVSLAAFLTGNGVRTSIQAGMSLAQIGEFSFIIASLGVALKATGGFLYPIAVAVSVVTSMTTPWLIRASGPVASFIDRKLPHRLQTFAALYGTWIERLREGRRDRLAGHRRLVLLLFVDAAGFAGVVIGASLLADEAAALVGRLGLGPRAAAAAVVVATVALAVPFCLGILRLTARLGARLAVAALPEPGMAKVDLAAAPRRALVVTLQLALLLAVGLPLLALTQPFLPGPQVAAILAVAMIPLGLAVGRSATNLDGHVRAGAEMIIEALTASTRSGPISDGSEPLAELHKVLPGLGEPLALRLDERSPAVGQTLGQLNLRGVTGASVLAITREEVGLVPGAAEVLRAGDVLALAGTRQAIEAAREVLVGGADGRRPA